MRQHLPNRFAAFNVVKHLSGHCRSEAWRKLMKRWGGRTRGNKVALVIKCLSPHVVKKLAEVPAAVERWELDIRSLAADHGANLEDDMKVAAIFQLVPTSLAEYLGQRIGDEETYDDVKNMVLRFVTNRTDFGGGCSPMDVGAVVDVPYEKPGYAYDKEKAKDEEHEAMYAFPGKGKGKGFQGACNLCGGWGHKAAECEWKGVCFKCGKSGHNAADCQAKGEEKGKGAKGNWAGKGQQQQPYGGSGGFG